MSDINVIDHLAGKFGSQSAVARAVGVQPHTICGKRKAGEGSGSLTHAQMRKLLKIAPSLGVELSPDDFFPEYTAEQAA